MIFDILSYPFMQKAILAGLLACISFGIIGTYVVTKRIVFISGGIAHASFGGVGIALFFNFDPILGALIFAVCSALGIGLISKKTLQREDTTIGIIWAIGMALGIFFIMLNPERAKNPASFLFGNIFMIQMMDIYLLGGLSVLILISTVLLFHKFRGITFDEEYCQIVGVKTLPLYLFLLVMVALTIVFLIKFVGIILVIAMLTIPCSIIGKFTNDLKKIMIWSTVLSALLILSGLWVSYVFDLVAGATIVILSGVVFLIVTGLKKFADSGISKEDLIHKKKTNS